MKRWESMNEKKSQTRCLGDICWREPQSGLARLPSGSVILMYTGTLVSTKVENHSFISRAFLGTFSATGKSINMKIETNNNNFYPLQRA